jgi:putative transposase
VKCEPNQGFLKSWVGRVICENVEVNRIPVVRIFLSSGLNLPGIGSFSGSRRLTRVLDQLKESQPLPERIRVDIGPELISAKLVAWCEKHQIQLHHIQPGKPTQNASIERFNRTLLVHVWLIDYNEERPHDFSQKPPARTLPQEPNNPKTSPNLNFRNAIPGPGGDERWLG